METKMYSMPVEKNEMKNYLIANFDKEEMRKINDDEAFINNFVRFSTQPNNERWFKYCDQALRAMLEKRNYGIEFVDRNKDNNSVMMIMFAMMHGFSINELIEILGY